MRTSQINKILETQAIKLTPHQFTLYQKLRRDILVPVWRIGEILGGISDREALNFIMGMQVPVYVFRRSKYNKRVLVFSSDIVKAVEKAERLPTLQLNRDLQTDAYVRQEERVRRSLGKGRGAAHN